MRASFTDPGKPDRQPALINWGDGESTASGAFDSFLDAFGGLTGELSHTRSYSDAGTFNLTLSVTDDDLDTTAESMAVPALMSEQALVKIIEMLDLLISGTTDPALKRMLRDARKALQWNGGSGARTNSESPAATASTPLIALVEQVRASLL